MQASRFFAYNDQFTLFGTQHLIALGVLLLFCLLLPAWAKRRLSPGKQLWLGRALAVFISAWAAAYVPLRLWLGDFDHRTDLPLDICNLTALLLPFLMWRPSFRVFELLYFWVFVGTAQALITPHLLNGFPNYIFFKYWIVHGGLLGYVVYALVVFDFRPNRKSVWRSFGYLQLYLLLVLLANLLLGSNYVYLLHKPPTASVLDYFGPWPWYILVGDGLALVAFLVASLPFRKREGSPGEQ